MTIKNLKKSNGFAASDALIAILIITLFTGIIASLLYNIYLSNASLKRMSKANGYIVDVFEYIDKAYYDEVSENDLILYFNNKYYSNEDAEVVAEKDEDTLVEKYEDMPFKVIIDLKSYSEIEGNPDTEELDLVKEITMTVKYKLGNKDQELTIKRIKSRERLVTPNEPDLNLLSLEQNEKVYPIKEINNNYVICNENDSNWYNYENNKFAKVLITNKTLEVGYQLTDEDTLIYQWIPRYAEDEEGNIQYLYSNTNKYVAEQEGYEELVELENGYTVEEDYFGEFTGVWEISS